MGFATLIAGVAAWTIWGTGEMFPKAEDPKGDPEHWTDEEMRRWLRAVGRFELQLDRELTAQQRSLQPTGKETRDELLTRIKANLRAPQT